MNTTTDAHDRAQRFLGALTREDMQKLRRIDAAKTAGMVLDGRKHAVPYEPGKIALSLEFGAATMKWNMSPAEMVGAAEHIAAGFHAQGIPPADWRQLAREGIAQTMHSDGHLDIAKGSLCAMLACFLMLDPTRGKLRSFAEAGMLRHAGYLITQTEAPSAAAPFGALNFRLVAGGGQ